VLLNGEVRYSSRHTHKGMLRKALKDGYISTTMFGVNANTPMLQAQDPCSQLLGAKVSWVPSSQRLLQI